MQTIGGTLVSELPKALLGLLVPVGQYAWTKYKDHNVEGRKRVLRQDVAALSAQRESLSKIADLRHGESVLGQIDEDLEAKLAELSAIGKSEVLRAAAPKQPSSRARWFLAYSPSGAAEWAAHLLFFLMVSLIGFGALGLYLSRGEDDDWPWDLASLLIFAIPAFVFRALANRMSRRRIGNDRSASQRTSRILPFTFFAIALCIIPVEWTALIFDNDDYDTVKEAFAENWLAIVAVSAFAICFAICAWGWAHAGSWNRATTRRSLRSAVMVFLPTRRVGWVPLICWYMGFPALISAISNLDSSDDDFAIFVLLGIPIFCGYFLSAWKWAQSFRPEAAVVLTT